jgi:sterol desaturase/sphingolipid hydroxylase (fatty acid hydroxylase superfamily)
MFSFGAFFIIAMWLENKVLIRQGKERYDLPETLANIVSSVLYKSADALYIIVFVGAMATWVQAHGLQLNIEYHWYTYVLIFIAQDFCFYLFHVVAHKMRFAWVSHKIHHSSKHFNFGVALRQSLLAPIPLFSIGFIIWAPFAFLGLDIATVAFIYELNLFYQFWIHTRTVERLPKWFEAIFNTPSHHRVHHGYGEKQIDCNYAGVFIIWDRLFGTFVNERDAGEILYGVKTRPVHSHNVFVMVFEELFDLVKTIWRNKDIRYLWHHPDWSPK